MRDFKKLVVWEKAHNLTLAVYRNTDSYPKEELFGLTSQLRRASASIPANIAEGFGRSGSAELARFLQISMGSASELEYHFILAHDLKYLSDESYNQLDSMVVEIKQMLTGLIQKVK